MWGQSEIQVAITVVNYIFFFIRSFSQWHIRKKTNCITVRNCMKRIKHIKPSRQQIWKHCILNSSTTNWMIIVRCKVEMCLQETVKVASPFSDDFQLIYADPDQNLFLKMKNLLSSLWHKVNITGDAADSSDFSGSLEQGVVLLDYLWWSEFDVKACCLVIMMYMCVQFHMLWICV